MKRNIRLIPVILATGVILSSCAKELLVEQGNLTPTEEGSRVIAVSFASQSATKTALGGEDGLTPDFVDGDEIFLCTNPKNQEEIKTETRTVSVNKEGKATISTNLAGELTAIYPAKGAEYFDKLERYDIGVPQIQSGRFADANICKATIASDASIAQFKNQFALFVITPPEGTQKLTIKSLPTIGDDGQRSGSAKFVNNLASGDGMYYMTVETPPAEGKYYVALLNGAKLSDLSFEAEFATAGTGSIKGIPMKAIEEAEAVNITASGTMYTINENNWHDYVTVGKKKWATMNLKTSETIVDYDDYYVWGTTVMAYSDIEAPPCSLAVMKTENPYGEDYKLTWAASNGFSWDNCPFTEDVYSESSKDVFTKYVTETSYGYEQFSDNKTRLDLRDDAAYVHWGGAWRMPTKEEFSAASTDLSLSGTLNATANNSKVEISDYESKGYYWSSTLGETEPSKASCWVVEVGENGLSGSCQEKERFYGCTIRAIIDEPDEETQED